MKDTLILALPLLVMIAVLALGIWCERYSRRHRPNRRTSLRAPDSRAVVGNWWRDCPPVERR